MDESDDLKTCYQRVVSESGLKVLSFAHPPIQRRVGGGGSARDCNLIPGHRGDGSANDAGKKRGEDRTLCQMHASWRAESVQVIPRDASLGRSD